MTNTKLIIRQAMANRGMNIESLSKKMGYKNGRTISSKLSNTSEISIKGVLDMLTALGCEIVVRDKMGTHQKWVVQDLPEDEEE